MSGNTPLRFLGVGNVLDREYRNTPAYQWARELIRNGIEAKANNIQLDVEWEGVAARGVYRLQYADDGVGMDKEHLRDYMWTLGKGSKVVGGPHDNYALGCRMTLLPWNPEGVVVISVVDGEANMVKLMYDPDSADGAGEYVLAEEEWIDEDGHEGRALVYPPYVDDELGFNWLDTIPDFITEAGHGTTFIMLGRSLSENTFNGDVERGEDSRFLARKYFNTRFWDLPADVNLRCRELPEDRAKWPKARDDKGIAQFRTVKGALEVAEYVKRGGEGTVQAKGTVDLSDGTKAHWWLRKEGVDTGGVGSSSGFIGVLYRGELYAHAYANQEDGDFRIGANVYRQFGIGADEVRRRVFIVLEPTEYDELSEREGVAPSTGRADLYWIGGTRGGARQVKPGDWANDFADKMPDDIAVALAKASSSSTATSAEREERLKRVMDRFSKRWRVGRATTNTKPSDANTTTRPTSPGTTPRQSPDTPSTTSRKRKSKKRVITGRSGSTVVGGVGVGNTPAKKTSIMLGYPDHRWVNAADINDEGMLAAWQGPSKANPNGVVELDQTHPVVTGQIEYWQSQYPKAVADRVGEIVKDAYADVAIAKVSHLHALADSQVISEEARDRMLENEPLTASLIGLISEDALISPRMGAIGTKRKRDDEKSSTSENVA